MRHCAILLGFVLVRSAHAQFVPALLQNDSYWGDGKAEFDIYDAQVMRDGQPHATEALIVFRRETLPPDASSKAGPSEACIRMTRVLQLPRGLFVEQQTLGADWRTSDSRLAKIAFLGTDTAETVTKNISEISEPDGAGWKFIFDSSRLGSAPVDSKAVSGPPAIFYDELPLRVRTIDFRKNSGEFEIALIPTIISANKDSLEARPAKISYRVSDRAIMVEVKHGAGTDQFALDRVFPFLLREWTAADGSHFKMKNSLKADYWNFGRNGDRERALKHPMLRHPD